MLLYLCGKVVRDHAALLVAKAGVELDAEVNRRARTRAVLRSQKYTRPINEAWGKCTSNRQEWQCSMAVLYISLLATEKTWRV